MVEVPTAKITAIENSRLIKGTDRFTALMAYSPTPLATNRPSTMEYREKTMREATVAVEKRKNCLRKLCCSCILDENSFPFSGVPHFIFPKNIISEEKSFVKMGYCEVKRGGV